MALSDATMKRLMSQSDAELGRLLDEIEERAAKGDRVMNPGRDIGTVTSATTKSVGADALDPDRGGFSAWTQWSDPSRTMKRKHRDAWLKKSLNEVGYKGDVPWGSLGEFLRDGWANHRDQDFIKKHRAPWADIDNSFFRARGMSTISGESGGFLVNPEMAPTIEELFWPNDLPSRIHTLPSSSTSFKWPKMKGTDRSDGARHGGVFHYWIDEGESGTESKPGFETTRLDMKKLAVFVFMTSEIMQNTPYAVEDYVRNAVQEEINFAVGRAIMWGEGGREPIGFANSGAVIEVAKETSQPADTVQTENILKMMSRLWRNGKASPVWLHHPSVISQIGALDLGNFPVNININNGGIAAAPATSLRGAPMVETELCAQLGDAGDIWYTDLRQYKAIAKSMIQEDVSIHVEFMTDQQCLRFLFYFDGAPLYDTPVTPYQAGTTAPATMSPFVRVAARA